MSRILAIDYGNKRVGLAVTDPLQIIATPLITVHSKEIMNFLKNYLDAEKVDTFVVGMPKNLDGTPCNFQKNVKIFITKLQKTFPSKDIYEYDERFSSKIARQTLTLYNFNKKERHDKANLDKVSAAVILQSFLDYKKNFKQ